MYVEAKIEVNDIGGQIFFKIGKLDIVSDILTKFYKDSFILSTKKSLFTDTCN